MPDTHDERGGDENVVTPEKAAFELRYWLDTRTGTDRLGRDVGIVLDALAAATARAEKAERQFNLVRSLNRLAKANAVELHAQLDAARARIAELGEPETEQRIIGVSGRVYTPTEFDLEHRSQWVPSVRLEERQVYPTPWRVVYPVCRSCGETDRVLDDPPLCSNCAVYGGVWSSQRPDASLDGLRGPFTGLLGPLGLATDATPEGRSEPVERSETSGGIGTASNSSTTAAGLSACCRATKVEGGVRHHCDSDAPHDTHECGDCAHRWDETTEDGQRG